MSYGFSGDASGVAGESRFPTLNREAGRWEFPALFRYRFARGRLRPFVGAGLSLNRVTGASRLIGGPAELRHRQALGFVFGGGLAMRLGGVRLAPEIRYTHWGDRNFGVRDAALRSRLDQVDLLVGVSFPVW